MKNTTSIKVPKKYQHMVDEVFKDPEVGYWCYANKGYYFGDADYGIHIVREDTQKLILDMIKSMEPCDCDECRGGK